VLSPVSQTFAEVGLQATVGCKVNETDSFGLKVVDDKSVPRIYQTTGDRTLPEGFSISTTTYFDYLDEDVFSWASVYNNHSTSWFAFAAMPDGCTEGNWTSCHGYGFAQLQKTQCRLGFTAKSFELSVDNVARTITVTPQNSLAWPAYADVLLETLAAEHSSISQTDGSFGGSTLGKAIVSNINILSAYRNETIVTKDTRLQAVEAFIADLMDNYLMSFSQSRYFLNPNERQTVDTMVAREVIVYGEKKYIYATLVLNLLVLLVCLGEAVSSRFWVNVNRLGLLDIASVAIEASRGETQLAASVQALPVKQDSGVVAVRLRRMSGGLNAIEHATKSDSLLDTDGH
jgi:hypothetical protein